MRCAVLSPERLPQLPNVPSRAEAGIREEIDRWARVIKTASIRPTDVQCVVTSAVRASSFVREAGAKTLDQRWV